MTKFAFARRSPNCSTDSARVRSLCIGWAARVCTLVPLLACSPGPAVGEAETSGGTNEAFELRSSDGKLLLEIPGGALPSGVLPEDLSIEARSEEELALVGATYIGAYDLQPDGLEFLEPVGVSWSLEGDYPGLTFVHTSTQDVGFPSASLSQGEDGEARYAFEINHFSQIHAQYATGQFSVERIAEVSAAPVGGFVTATYVIGVANDAGEYRYRLDSEWDVILEWTNLEASGWDLTGDHSEASDTRILSPGVRSFEAFDQGFAAGYTLPPLRCAADGATTVKRELLLVGDVKFTLIPDDLSSLSGTAGFKDFGERYLDEASITCDAPSIDPIADFLDSISSLLPTFTPPSIEVVSHAVSEISLTAVEAAAWSGGAAFGPTDDPSPLMQPPATLVGFPASPKLQPTRSAESGDAPDQLVVRASGELPLEAGALLVGTLSLDACLGDQAATNSFVYSMVLDSDGQPENDWVFNPPFDFDLFQGADRWYQLTWDHVAQSWSLECTQVQTDQSTVVVDSGAWAVIDDSNVNFFIPEAEYDPTVASYRMTAFGHDGQFSESERGADVSGTDPSEALLPVQP